MAEEEGVKWLSAMVRVPPRCRGHDARYVGELTLRKKEEEEVEGEKDNKGDGHVYMALFIYYLFYVI